MPFKFRAFCNMLVMLLTTALIFFASWHIVGSGKLRTDYKNTLNVLPVQYLESLVFPENFIQVFFCVVLLCAPCARWLILGLNMPPLAYCIWRYHDPMTIMNVDILVYCQKEGWCNLLFYLLGFFFLNYPSSMIYILMSS
ncbi:unnamed protein product [Nyctereutes procyonoides]|uniref:(raccoon dog) hypothetical protein n=1 Tax=Nyctereutes procyonoides TaxID=34880 RepID=A0A811Z8S7_NYCPR|nr:unnamed protein product [Nyctereutes procyonoides]